MFFYAGGDEWKLLIATHKKIFKFSKKQLYLKKENI